MIATAVALCCNKVSKITVCLVDHHGDPLSEEVDREVSDEFNDVLESDPCVPTVHFICTWGSRGVQGHMGTVCTWSSMACIHWGGFQQAVRLFTLVEVNSRVTSY